MGGEDDTGRDDTMIEAIVKLALGSEVVQAAAAPSGSDLVIFWAGEQCSLRGSRKKKKTRR